MNKREIKRWRKAIEETREKFTGVRFERGNNRTCIMKGDEEVGYEHNDCAFCRIANPYKKRTGRADCSRCIVMLSGCGVEWYAGLCVDILESAREQRRTRPIHRALDRMERWLILKESEKNT